MISTRRPECGGSAGVSRPVRQRMLKKGRDIQAVETRMSQSTRRVSAGCVKERVRIKEAHMVTSSNGSHGDEGSDNHVNIDMSRTQAHLLASARCFSAANARFSACGFD